VFLVYAETSRAVGRGEFLLPLDDVYIHFQYARQLAAGQPYVYNPGLPASSGATSFLYPYILAVGYLLGFQGLNLGLWAMIVGALALAGSLWLVYQLARSWGVPEWMAAGLVGVFGFSGPVAWHFMSGMETGVAIFLTLWTLYAVSRRGLRQSILAATLLALIRPEGGLLALLAVPVILWETRPLNRRQVWLLLLVLAVGVQPLVNLLVTGSAVASGNAAKSVFGAVPCYWDAALGRVFDQFIRIWREFISGSSDREGMYLLVIVPALGILGLARLLTRRDRRALALMLLGWFLVGTAAIATLDTAFWHFKRYQMPLLVLAFPLFAYGLAVFTRRGRIIAVGAVGVALLASLWTGWQFLGHYALNVDYIYRQPLQMARWLAANTSEDAVIAVHDVGMMRYMGGRTTLDMVGLTTPGAADYWRAGPGAVAEFLLHAQSDYVASYGAGHGYGLGEVAEAGVYGDLLASFPVDLDPNYNVALAADFQGIYKPDWTTLHYGEYIRQRSICDNYFKDCSTDYHGPMTLASAQVDVADLESESQAHYRWQDSGHLTGFPTEVHQLNYIGCENNNCNFIDGGRLINGEEYFDFEGGIVDEVVPDDYYLLVTRLLPDSAGTYDVYANDHFVATRWIPEIKGEWLEIATLIPRIYLTRYMPGNTDFTTQIRIVPHVVNGYYMPYEHTIVYYSKDRIATRPATVVSTFQDGAIVLSNAEITYQPDVAQVAVNFEWYTDGSARGDYKLFVHLYKEANQPPLAQTDSYPGGGTLPPGNWLPGVLRDTITVDLSNVPPGDYTVAIGLYNPYTDERLQPEGGDDQGRLPLGEVEVVSDGR
jgi:hypothetical protein